MPSDKEKAKLEKKRAKAQLKIEKARAKSGLAPGSQKAQYPMSAENKWYRNPSWIRAIVAIISLVVMIIALLFTVYS